MPLLKITMSIPNLNAEQTSLLQAECSSIISKEIGKSLDFIMVLLEFNQTIYFAQNAKHPAAYLELKNVGQLVPELTNRLSDCLSRTVNSATEIPLDRIYIEFQESARHHWGWNGKTFH